VASDDKTVRLWDTGTGAALQTLESHTRDVWDVALSPDGKTVASASLDETVRLWDTGTGAVLQTLKGHTHYVRAVAISPDGKTVASASFDGTVRLWNTETGAALQTVEGHTRDVWAVAISPDGKTVASASPDETVRLWDTGTGAILRTVENCFTQSLVFSRNGSYLETSHRVLYIQSDSTKSFAPQLQPLSTVFLRGNWITQGGANLLWLPFEYRSSCSASRVNLLLLGYPSGKVTFIESSPL